MPISGPLGRPRSDLAGAYNQFNPVDRGLIARRVLPELTVPDYTGRLHVLPAEVGLRDAGAKVNRAVRGARSRSEFGFDTVEFVLREFSHEVPVDLTQSTIYSEQDPDAAAMMIARQVIETRYERVVAERLFNETTFPQAGETGFAVTHEWNDIGNATPISDIARGREFLRKRRGVMPLKLVITSRIRNALNSNNQILQRMQYVDRVPGVLSDQQLAFALGVDELIVAGGTYVSSAPNKSSPTFTDIWNDEWALLFYGSGGDITSSAQLGRTLEIDAATGLRLFDYEDEKHNSIVYAAETHLEDFVIDPGCGVLLSNIVDLALTA